MPGGGGGGGGVCEMRAIHGVKKMVNYYPLIAHIAQRMKFLTESCPVLSYWTILPAIQDTENHPKQAFKFKEIALKDKLHCPLKGFCCV